MLLNDKEIDCEKLDEELNQFLAEEKSLEMSASNEIKYHLLEQMEQKYLKIIPNTPVEVVFELFDALPIVAGHLSDNPKIKTIGKISENSWELRHKKLADIQDTWFRVKIRIDELRIDDWMEGLKVFHKEGFESACTFLLNCSIVCIPKRAIA